MPMPAGRRRGAPGDLRPHAGQALAEKIWEQVEISRYARLRPSHGQIRLETVFDEDQERYALMQVVWDRGARVRGNLICVTLDDEQVCVEYDGIERGIVDHLVRLGIPRDKIVLTFLPVEAETRVLT